jgi:hypothetical protein
MIFVSRHAAGGFHTATLLSQSGESEKAEALQ